MTGICIDVISGQAAQVDTFYPDPTNQAAEIAARRIAEIDARLTSLDLASIRALTAKALNTATEEDLARLAEIEAEKATLRSERSLINV